MIHDAYIKHKEHIYMLHNEGRITDKRKTELLTDLFMLYTSYQSAQVQLTQAELHVEQSRDKLCNTFTLIDNI